MIYLELFWSFFQVGLFTFGGGYAMLPLIESEIERHGWLPVEELVNFIAVSESTPGPFAINISTYVGMQTGGVFGAFCATFGVVLPSFVVILIVAKCLQKFRSNQWVQGGLFGIKAAVVGLISASAISVAASVFFPQGLQLSVFSSPEFWASCGIFAVAAVLTKCKLHPIFIICISALLGIAAGYLIPGMNILTSA